jgi:aspartate carbamoyltransferase catalytic subunit
MSVYETASLEEAMPKLDVLYMTRIQRERFKNLDDYERLKDSYILTLDKLNSAKEDMIILHPLPRVNEISTAVDEDKRAAYFRQARNGKFIRMALILKLLNEKEGSPKVLQNYNNAVILDKACKNHNCITTTEQEIKNAFYKNADEDFYRCAYCDNKLED